MAGGFIELALRLQRPRKEKKGQRKKKKRSKNEQKSEKGEEGEVVRQPRSDAPLFLRVWFAFRFLA